MTSAGTDQKTSLAKRRIDSCAWLRLEEGAWGGYAPEGYSCAAEQTQITFAVTDFVTSATLLK